MLGRIALIAIACLWIPMAYDTAQRFHSELSAVEAGSDPAEVLGNHWRIGLLLLHVFGKEGAVQVMHVLVYIPLIGATVYLLLEWWTGLTMDRLAERWKRRLGYKA